MPDVNSTILRLGMFTGKILLTREDLGGTSVDDSKHYWDSPGIDQNGSGYQRTR
jgi:hypothetical protein